MNRESRKQLNPKLCNSSLKPSLGINRSRNAKCQTEADNYNQQQKQK